MEKVPIAGLLEFRKALKSDPVSLLEVSRVICTEIQAELASLPKASRDEEDAAKHIIERLRGMLDDNATRLRAGFTVVK